MVDTIMVLRGGSVKMKSFGVTSPQLPAVKISTQFLIRYVGPKHVTQELAGLIFILFKKMVDSDLRIAVAGTLTD